MIKAKRYKVKVLKGAKIGQTINLRTINLDPTILKERIKTGVYAVQVKYKGQVFLGALYFGPRLVKNETNNILEIHILNFNQEIYGEEIEFQIIKFIRKGKNFKSLAELKKQVEKDIKIIILTSSSTDQAVLWPGLCPQDQRPGRRRWPTWQ